MSLEIVRVQPQIWRRFATVRLAALAEAPGAFGSTLAREVAFDEAEWVARARRPATFLAMECGPEGGTDGGAIGGGVDVGIAGAYCEESRWRVAGMWVVPRLRGAGVVDALLGACVETAAGEGADTLYLSVMADNARGRAAYERHGFCVIGQREPLPDGRVEVLMSRQL